MNGIPRERIKMNGIPRERMKLMEYHGKEYK